MLGRMTGESVQFVAQRLPFIVLAVVFSIAWKGKKPIQKMVIKDEMLESIIWKFSMKREEGLRIPSMQNHVIIKSMKDPTKRRTMNVLHVMISKIH